MNLKEAYKILEVSENSTDEELKIRYKELAKLYHPDVYKQDPNKFKLINQAYQFIKENKNKRQNPFGRDDANPFSGGFGFNINDFFSQHQQKSFDIPPPFITLKISFEDSILGCSKEIKFTRYSKCDNCDGNGSENISNGCTNCNGFGRVIVKQRNMVSQSTCTKCYGKNVSRKECNKCNSNGIIENEITLNVNIPAGIENNSTLRLQAMGNYAGSNMFGDAYSDAFVNIIVEQNKNMVLSGNNVISNIDISLLEALIGCKKQIKTVYGEKEINISPASKNKDEIKIDKCGVKNKGDHIVVLNVNYPKDLSGLINVLSN